MQTHAGYTKPCWTLLRLARDVRRAGAYAVTADRTDIYQRRPTNRFDNFSIGLLL